MLRREMCLYSTAGDAEVRRGEQFIVCGIPQTNAHDNLCEPLRPLRLIDTFIWAPQETRW
jgi:hypothetical protein